jgi:cytochrome c-type biogenesis protein CcmH/NrfG
MALSNAHTALAKAKRNSDEEFDEALKSALQIDPNNTEALGLANEPTDNRDGS